MDREKFDRHFLRRLWRRQIIMIIVAVLLHSLFGMVQSQSCVPDGWHQFGDTIYRVETTLRDYSSANAACQILGGELAILNTQEIQTFVTNLVNRPCSNGVFYWFGLNDREDEGTYRWIDGTTLTPGTARWDPGQPDNSANEDCIELLILGPPSISTASQSRHGNWNDRVCSEQRSYICSKRLDGMLPVLFQRPTLNDYGSDYILISWTSWNDAVDTGDGPASGYVIYIKTGSDDWKSTGYVSETTVTNTAEYNVTRLWPQTEYKLSVTTIQNCSGLEGVRSPELTIMTRSVEFTLPVFRQPPHLSAYGSDHILIRWNAWNDAVDTGDGPVSGYVIYIKTGNDDWKSTGYVSETTVTNHANTAEYNVTRLRPETEYKLSVTTIQKCAGVEGLRGPELTIVTRSIPQVPSTSTAATENGESGNGTTIPWAICGVSLAGNIIAVIAIIVLCMRRRGSKSETQSPANPPGTTKMGPSPDYNNPAFYSEVIAGTGRS